MINSDLESWMRIRSSQKQERRAGGCVSCSWPDTSAGFLKLWSGPFSTQCSSKRGLRIRDTYSKGRHPERHE
ncbi:hypothetical protein EYC80_003832 [Monilinia laxa]|uniref:Uncharacterized protein n=1 Tax=Monilinia laxa TaxID=61186 RepID=A0A5N6KKY7_MONLA|nr:hypothetical protein EYC80_003832 [Monilinia laxa]